MCPDIYQRNKTVAFGSTLKEDDQSENQKPSKKSKKKKKKSATLLREEKMNVRYFMIYSLHQHQRVRVQNTLV